MGRAPLTEEPLGGEALLEREGGERHLVHHRVRVDQCGRDEEERAAVGVRHVREDGRRLLVLRLDRGHLGHGARGRTADGKRRLAEI